MKALKKITFAVLFSIELFIALIIGYLALAFVLAMIPVNTDFASSEEGIDLLVMTNGVHTDLCVPTKTAVMDWSGFIDPNDFAPNSNRAPYIAFGWGDKGFYLDTPTWADLKASTAVKAMFLESPTAMHVSYLLRTPKASESVKSIRISVAQYTRLVQYIKSGFTTTQGKAMLIENAGYYNMNDNFYEGKGSYYLLKTCNVWANNGLKTAGVKTALWAPFDWCIFHHFN